MTLAGPSCCQPLLSFAATQLPPRLSSAALGLVLALALPSASAQTPSVDPTAPKVVPLWPEGSVNNPPSGPPPIIELFLPLTSSSKIPATVVVFPGGGYASISRYERLQAEYFRSLGYAAAVLHYRVRPHRHPAPFADAARALRLLRHHGSIWGMPTEAIVLVGGSAGGHLAALLATRPDLHHDPEDDLASTVSPVPDRLILLYPAITGLGPHAAVSFERLLGPTDNLELRQALSPELHVGPQVPPTLVFHAMDDAVVSAEHSIAFARACWAAGVQAELHVFPRGGHGRAFAYDPVVSPRWRALARDWLDLWLAGTSQP